MEAPHRQADLTSRIKVAHRRDTRPPPGGSSGACDCSSPDSASIGGHVQ
jgi:hypothetical protein